MQVLSLITIEPPVSLDANDVRDEKVKLFKSIEPINIDDVVIGQYKRRKIGLLMNFGFDSFFLALFFFVCSRYVWHDGCSSWNTLMFFFHLCPNDFRPFPRPLLPTGNLYVGSVEHLGYRDDPTVPDNSITPTFCAFVLKINNRRWWVFFFSMKSRDFHVFIGEMNL